MSPVGRAAGITAGTEDALIVSLKEGAGGLGSEAIIERSSSKGSEEPRPYRTEASIEQKPISYEILEDSVME
ncbi:MAG: hypothetical protein AAGJ80_01605 [Cyanobacteria bacterium J06553_1]